MRSWQIQKSLDSRFRGNDDVAMPSPCRAWDMQPSPCRAWDMHPSSFPRKRESSVVGTLAIVLMTSAAPAFAQEWVSLEKADGAAVFGEKCGMCHRATGMGTGILARRMSPELALLENRTDLQPALIETAVRSGFGVMFPISRAEVSDAQLQMLVEYLTENESAAAQERAQ
jgi:cytochrome c553